MNVSRRASIEVDSNNAVTDILGPNALTGVGVVYAGATCVASTMLLATAMPAQVVGSMAIAGGLYTAGQLKAAGKLPSQLTGIFGSDEDKAEAPEAKPTRNGKSTKTAAAAA